VFKGRQQHDAHELLRMLLDGLQVRSKQRRRAWCSGARTPRVGHDMLSNASCVRV
jgi:hypothetical protein